MRAQVAGLRAWTVAAVLACLLATPAVAADPSPSPVPSAAPPITAALFLATGDPVEGWQWLRDEVGGQYATWSFAGVPAGDPVTVTFALLATDAVNGGPGVEATAWITIGAIEDGGPGPAILGPSLQVFPNVSTADDPVGYQTLGTMTIEPGELSPTMEGLWVLVERRAPTGAVVPSQVAVNRDAVTVTGLAPAPPCATCLPVPEASPAG